GHLVDVWRDVVDAKQLGTQPDALADVDRRNEAHPIQPIVDAHLRVQVNFDALPGAHQDGKERERQVAVRDRATKLRFGRALRIHMDPLMVAGNVREVVHSLLGHLDPIARAELLADQLFQLFDRLDGSRRNHSYSFLDLSLPPLTLTPGCSRSMPPLRWAREKSGPLSRARERVRVRASY